MPNESKFDLYWGNDCVPQFILEKPSTDALKPDKFVPLEDGEAEAFLCNLSDIEAETAETPTAAEAANSALVAEATHVGKGRWRATFQSDVLTLDLMNELFSDPDDPPCCVIVHDGGIRTYIVGTYKGAREAAQAS